MIEFHNFLLTMGYLGRGVRIHTIYKEDIVKPFRNSRSELYAASRFASLGTGVHALVATYPVVPVQIRAKAA